MFVRRMVLMRCADPSRTTRPSFSTRFPHHPALRNSPSNSRATCRSVKPSAYFTMAVGQAYSSFAMGLPAKNSAPLRVH